MGYKGQIKINKMSAAPVQTKKPTTKTHKMTRKQRRHVKEVATLQERTTSILPATTFKRIVTQEAQNHSSGRLRFNADAIHALQTATEQEITRVFSGAAFCAEIGKRDTVTVEDIRNFQAIRHI